MTTPHITNPLPSDVLCGRGGGTNHHIGNSHWRNLVSANKRLYLTLPKRQKALVAKSIVHAIRSQNPPGRFLQKADDEFWYDIGDKRACEKTSQALREGAPEIRTEMRDEKTSRTGPLMRLGQILPNGLLALDYERVEMEDNHDKAAFSGKDGVISKKRNDRDKIGKTGSDVSFPQHAMSRDGLSELSMRRAFEQFQAGLMPHQQQEKQSKSSSVTTASAIGLSTSDPPASSLPLQCINETSSAIPPAHVAQSSAAEVVKSLERPTSDHQTPQTASLTPGSGLDRVTSMGAHQQRPHLSEKLNQLHFRQSTSSSRSYDPTTLLHNHSIHALLPQTSRHLHSEQEAASGTLSHQLPTVNHPNSYDIAVDLLMREKLFLARQKASFAEARLQNLQQIHNLQQHAQNASVGMRVGALGGAPQCSSSFDHSDSISRIPEFSPSMIGRGHSSLTSEELMNLRTAWFAASGGLRHASMAGICLPARGLPSNCSVATMAHLRMIELWNHQRRQLVGLTGEDAFARSAGPFGTALVMTAETEHSQNAGATVDVERQGSMEYLVKAAGMANQTDRNDVPVSKSDGNHDDLTLRQDCNLSKNSDAKNKTPEKTNADWENMKKASRRAAKLKLGKNDQSLMEDSDNEVDTIPPSLTKRKRKRKPKNSTSTNKLETMQLHSSETLSTLASDPNAEFHRFKRKPHLSPSHREAIAASKTNHHALCNLNPLSATTSASTSSKDMQGKLPLAETSFNRGHSHTLSEVSMERVHSLSDEQLDTNAIGGDGQFDDPEDEG